MAISVVAGSAKISAIRAPSADRPTMAGGKVNYNPGIGMHAAGDVKLTGNAGDVRVGWQVGWIQAQWVETNWAEYRGQFDHDGGIFLQRGRAPARPPGACRDTSGVVGTIFTDPTDPTEFQTLPAVGAFPIAVHVETNDTPGEGYNQIEMNSLTGKPNFLHEIQLEFLFCTVLTVRDPILAFHHQGHFFWNVRWQTQFQPTAFPAPTDAQWRVTPLGAPGTGAAARGPFGGNPTEAKFTGVLTTPQVASCVDRATQSAAAVAVVGNACRREFPRWHSSDVRK
jgi:hypothetical protein